MRSATPRRPLRHRYTPRPAQTPAGRYTARPPLHADQGCYGVAVLGRPAAAARLLETARRRPRRCRYTTAAVAR